MSNSIVLAPIKGYTDPLWRSCYFDHFNYIEKVVTPFLLLSEHNRAKKGYFSQFLPELGSNVEVVPQYLVKSPEAIIYSSEIMAGMGVREFNLNMGCPAPAIYKKGRGSGLLESLDTVDRILKGVIGKIDGDFTVKIRTGIEDSSLIEPVIEVLNRYPLKEVIVHPRNARQLYSGVVDINAFRWVYNNSTNPVSYNGDILNLGDFLRLKEEFPLVSSWMIGRGVLRDPLLPEIIKTGIEPDREVRKKRVTDFILDLRNRLNTAYKNESIAVSRLKACLIYIGSFYNESEDFINSIKRSRDSDQMLDIIFLN